MYDQAGVFRDATRQQVEATIDGIEERTGAEVVVYSQLVPDGTTDADAERQAIALIDQWGVGRRGFDDGLAILFDLYESDPCHGRIQLYAGPGYRATFLSNSERQAIFDNDMLPLLRGCDLDGALLAAMAKVDAAATPEHASSLAFYRQLDAVLGLLVAPLLLVAARRVRAVRLVPPRPRPGLPRRSVDPHSRAAGGSHARRRGRAARRQVDPPRAHDGQPRPRVAWPHHVQRRVDGPAGPDDGPVDPHGRRVDRRSRRDGPDRAGACAGRWTRRRRSCTTG